MPRGKQVFHAVDPKRTQGLFPRKYTVTRTDGSSEKGASTRTAASSSWTSTTTLRTRRAAGIHRGLRGGLPGPGP